MARAIVAGACDAGVITPSQTAACDPHAERNPSFGETFVEIEAAEAWLDARPGAGLVIATKPQVLADVAACWAPILGRREPMLVVSILAGITSSRIADSLGPKARVVRVMPNTPIQLGLGMSALSGGPGSGAADLDRVERLFASCGETVRIDEGLMDAFTGVAGSGPAYVFYLAEAMAEAAIRLGFTPGQSSAIVRQTVAGAGELLRGSPESPRALRAAVTSEGGTTAAATGVLDSSGVQDAVVRAVHAARDRGAELSG